jgi:uncharacterized protein DUF5691
VTTLSYEDLVAAATVGLGHSRLRVTGLPGPAASHAGVLDPGDPAAALLDAAALMTTARRAGVRPAVAQAPTGPVPADTRPELSARAADLLGRARGSDPALLADLLTLAARNGYRAPAPLLPALLDAAVKDYTLRPPVAAVLGARGRWLARHRLGWRRVADMEDPGPAIPAASGDPRVWETGNREERRSYLAGLRRRDLGAARDLLAAGWSRESGDDRTDLIAVLAHGLSAGDEDFLEQALDDRKEAVRAGARRLLAKLPGSALNRRAADRAAPLLRLKQRGEQCWLTASLPAGADEAAIRDGIMAMPPPHRLAGAWLPAQVMPWLLIQMIAAAPLAGWVSQFGLDARQIVSLPFPGGLGAEVLTGWRIAAISQASAEWAETLLAVGQPRLPSNRPPMRCPDERELAALLPPEARMARVAAMLSDVTSAPAGIAEIAGFPRPWSGPLADAVIALLRQVIATASGRVPAVTVLQWPEQLASAAGRGLPVAGRADFAAALEQLAAAAHCPQSWSLALRRAVDTIALRRAFLEEIR